jgi:CoA:oxalate CoA-transferase
MKKGPLDGIRVVEISLFEQGPVAGMRLRDLGDEVIKVESPAGAPCRGFMKIIGARAGIQGNNYYFEHGNRNKRTIPASTASPPGAKMLPNWWLSWTGSLPPSPGRSG